MRSYKVVFWFPCSSVGIHTQTLQRHVTLERPTLHSHAGAWERGAASDFIDNRHSIESFLCHLSQFMSEFMGFLCISLLRDNASISGRLLLATAFLQE